MTPSPTPLRPLSAVLQEAAADLQTQAPPAALQARVRHAVRAARPASRQGATRAGTRLLAGRGGLLAWSGGAAFAAVLGVSVLLLVQPPPAQVDDGLRYGEFVPVAPAERWPRGPAAAWLVSTELQGERLSALGLPYDPGRAGDAVRAELLLHPSGEVLAVRLLN